MADLKRSFLGGKMNKDLDERLVPDGQYRDALNIDIIHSEGEDAGAAKNKLGNTRLSQLSNVAGQLIENCKTIGAVVSETDNLIYWLIASDKFDGIYEYSKTTGATQRILQSNKATPSTASKLNFDQDYYVTGINYIDGFLYWTDDLNPPRRIKIERARAYNVDDDRIDDDISVIVAPPLYAPTIELPESITTETNIEDKFVQFAYRWKTIDNQYTALSPFSGTAFLPDNYEIDYGLGFNKAMVNACSEVTVRFETGGFNIKEIQLVARYSDSTVIKKIDTFVKKDLGLSNNNVGYHKFLNNKVYSTLAPDQLTRLFDNVPLKAKSQEIIGRRLIYGNYVQFYDIKDTLNNEVPIDFNISVVSEDIVVNTPTRSFRTDRDYEIGIEYSDKYGRLTTVITPTVFNGTSSSQSPQGSGNTLYIPPTLSDKGNSIKVEINNKPPAFATNYRLVIKQAKKGYYNLFPQVYYRSGTLVYFKINPIDQPKIKVGDYIVLKTGTEGPTYSNKKYKILSIGTQQANWIQNGSVAGIYFSIKAESNDFSAEYSFSHKTNAFGANSTVGSGFCDQGSRTPIVVGTTVEKVVEQPIFYGTGNGNSLSVVQDFNNNPWNYGPNQNLSVYDDLRYLIKVIGVDPVTGNNTFEYGLAPGVAAGVAPTPNYGVWRTDVVMTTGQMPIYWTDGSGVDTYTLFYIKWSQLSGHKIGDSWRVNCRGYAQTGQGFSWKNTFNGNLKALVSQGYGSSNVGGDGHGGFCIVPGQNWSDTTDIAIEAGAQLTFKIKDFIKSNNPSNWQPTMQFTSTRRYENIEEWFYEDEIYNQWHQDSDLANPVDIGPLGIYFRRGIDVIPPSLSNSNATQQSQDMVSGGTVPTPTNMKYPVRMLIKGFGLVGSNSCKQNGIQVEFTLRQNDVPTVCETIPLEDDSEIYYETTDTYPVENGYHKVLWSYEDFTAPAYANGNTNIGQANPGTPNNPGTMRPHNFQVGNEVTIATAETYVAGTHTVTHVEDAYNFVIDLPFSAGPPTPGTVSFTNIERDQTFNQPAVIQINHPQNPNSTFNSWAFGNGLESDRIRDDFNEDTLEYSPRGSSTVEGYKQERKEASLTYSGVYREDTTINRLNEFNLSNANFRNIDTELGSIQKLFSRDTNIVVFQEDKISKILYGKNLLSDSTGGGTITSIPEVLGTQIPDIGEWGISFNPESFAQWGKDFFWTDSRRGAILSMNGDSISNISNLGMKSYFRDLFRDNTDTQKIGVYDPYSHHYVIASNENTSRPCSLELSSDGDNYASGVKSGIEVKATNQPDFSVISNASWTAAIVYSAGSNWVTGWPAAGFGNQDVYLGVADNNTGVVRTATITFTYCSGLTKTYIVTQGAGVHLVVNAWVLQTYQP
jgi:hypothetical protein